MAHKIATRADIRLFRKGYSYGAGRHILLDCTTGEALCHNCGADKTAITQLFLDGHDLYFDGDCDYDDPDFRCNGCLKILSAYFDEESAVA